MMIWERTPDRGSRGPAIRVTTPRPQTASHTLTSNQHFAQEKTRQCCYALIHQSRGRDPYRMPMCPQPFLSLLEMTQIDCKRCALQNTNKFRCHNPIFLMVLFSQNSLRQMPIFSNQQNLNPHATELLNKGLISLNCLNDIHFHLICGRVKKQRQLEGTKAKVGPENSSVSLCRKAFRQSAQKTTLNTSHLLT